MIVVIDNYDSFTFNIVQMVGEQGEEVQVFRNDAISLPGITALAPSGIIISPGPGRPEEAGISEEVIRQMGRRIPILGVCLGHQAIATASGGHIRRADRLLHGKTCDVHHDGTGVHAGIPSPFEATRYHSLIVDEQSLPDVLRVTATSSDGEIMGLAHRVFPMFGVQYHPESYMTRAGVLLVRNFLNVVSRWTPNCCGTTAG